MQMSSKIKRDSYDDVAKRIEKMEYQFARGKYPHSEMHYRVRMMQELQLLETLRNQND